MSFSDILRELAEERNLTQKQLAVDMGIPASTIGGYFQGVSEPDLDVVRRLAEYFDCSVDYMLEIKSKAVLDRSEDELLRVFRAIPAEQRPLYIELGKTIARHQAR